MVYKVKVVNKDKMEEIRYIISSDVISNEVSRMSEIDAIRDIANNIIKKQPSIDYASATKLAKDIRKQDVQSKDVTSLEKENTSILPGLESEKENDSNYLFGLEPQEKVKQMVLNRN